MDDFFDKAKEVLDNFKDITGPLAEQKDKFYEATGFYAVPGAGKRSPIFTYSEVKHGFLGMFYSLITIVKVSPTNFFIFKQGKFEDLELNIKTESPYVFINTGVLGSTGNALYEGFVNYAKALEACVTEKMP